MYFGTEMTANENGNELIQEESINNPPNYDRRIRSLISLIFPYDFWCSLSVPENGRGEQSRGQSHQIRRGFRRMPTLQRAAVYGSEARNRGDN
jgi:hypothetical protein